jgi:hypothetical protein
MPCQIDFFDEAELEVALSNLEDAESIRGFQGTFNYLRWFVYWC